MTTTWHEQFESRRANIQRGQGSTGELRYYVKSDAAADDTDVRNAINAQTPATFAGFERDRTKLDRISDDGDWLAVVSYGENSSQQPNNKSTGESSFSFEFGAGQQLITQSIGTEIFGGPLVDYKQSIGWDGKRVQGVQIVVPTAEFSETHYVPITDVTTLYKVQLYRLVGKTNDTFFKGMEFSECLFMGASGSQRGEEDWQITYRFAFSPNRVNFKVGDFTVEFKGGWDVLDVHYEKDVDSDTLIAKPAQVDVHVVYDPGNFDLLGIGT